MAITFEEHANTHRVGVTFLTTCLYRQVVHTIYGVSVLSPVPDACMVIGIVSMVGHIGSSVITQVYDTLHAYI